MLKRRLLILPILVLIFLFGLTLVYSTPSKENFATMIKNNNGFLTSSTEYRLFKPISLTLNDDLSFNFIKEQGDLDWIKYFYKIQESHKETQWIPDIECSEKPITFENQSEAIEKTCVDNGYYEDFTIYEEVWEEASLQKLINKYNNLNVDEYLDIKVMGKRKQCLDGGYLCPLKVDNILNFAGFSYPEYAWWNSSCNSKYEVNYSNGIAYTFKAPIQFWLNTENDTNPITDSSKIYVVDSTESEEIAFDIITDLAPNVELQVVRGLEGGVSGQQLIYVYTNCTGASPTYSNNISIGSSSLENNKIKAHWGINNQLNQFYDKQNIKWFGVGRTDGWRDLLMNRLYYNGIDKGASTTWTHTWKNPTNGSTYSVVVDELTDLNINRSIYIYEELSLVKTIYEGVNSSTSFRQFSMYNASLSEAYFNGTEYTMTATDYTHLKGLLNTTMVLWDNNVAGHYLQHWNKTKTDNDINVYLSGTEATIIWYENEFAGDMSPLTMWIGAIDNTSKGNITVAKRWEQIARALDEESWTISVGSEQTVVNQPPTHSNPILNSTTIYNATNEDLTCLNQSTADSDVDTVTNIYSWFIDDNPLAKLNLPFEINADDYSGSGNDGTIYGADFVIGKYGNALEFDGLDDYVEVADNDNLDLLTHDLSISAWINYKQTGGHEYIVGKRSSGWQDGYAFYISSYGNLICQMLNATAGSPAASVSYTGSGLTFVTCVIDRDDKINIYQNGVLIGNSDSLAGTNWETEDLNSPYGLIIGAMFTSINDFNGTIDEVRIYDRALSSEEISEHYNLNYNKIKSNETSIDDVWKCKVTPNDGNADGSTLESNTILIKPSIYNITFNITSGEDGNYLTGVMIACNNTWGIASTPENPYTTKFYEGNYECKLWKIGYFNSTEIFTADIDKQVDIIMALAGKLTIQEHTWLEAIYNCLYEGNCKALNLLEEINETTTNIWDQFKPTDESVVLKEDILSNTLSSTQNITINYTITAPPKAGYSTGDYVPIRIAYWFLDSNNESCLDQDKRTDSNIAETTYCIPLIAETLGKVNQEVDFKVDLRPDLPSGTYTIVSDIEIDPNEIWIKHSQQQLGIIKVLEDNNKAIVLLTMEEISEEITTITEPKQSQIKSTGLKIVGPIKEKVEEIKSTLTSSYIVSIIAIVCSLLAIIVICFTVYKIKGKKE